MKQENFFTVNRDLTFTFDHVVPWDRIVPLIEEGFTHPDGPGDTAEAVDLYREVLTLVGEYAGHDIAGRAREVDEAGARHHEGPVELPEPLKRNLAGLVELGVAALSVRREYGGESFPFTVSSMVFEIVARACSNTMVQFVFYASPAMMILRFGSEELKKEWIPRLASGEISGSVAMTEPQAGSDVGRVSTTARETANGWRLSGRKQFITNGIGDVSVVLARSEPGSKGLKGLSLFLVERRREVDGKTVDNYVVERAEDKVCLTASATCGLVFDNSHAVLLGKRGEGWQEILTFMNESRVAIGIQGVGVAQASLEQAKTYAAERIQMGRPIREHPLVADMLLDMEASVAAVRALAYEATVAYDTVEGLNLEIAKLPPGDPRRTALEGSAKTAGRYLRELTPLVKWLGAEEPIRVCRLAMQVHGGYGVVKEYEVERLMRDSLILPIYEGTSQIQSLMAIKDLMKFALKRPAAFVGGTLSPSLAAARFDGELGRLYPEARTAINSSIRYLLHDLVKQGGTEGALAMLQGKPRIDDEQMGYILLHAERLTAALSHLHAARLLAGQSQRFPERLPLALRAMRRAGTVAAEAERAIKSGDRSTLQAIAAWMQERSAEPAGTTSSAQAAS